MHSTLASELLHREKETLLGVTAETGSSHTRNEKAKEKRPVSRLCVVAVLPDRQPIRRAVELVR